MDSTQRFSKTVENYVKYRPSYPREILQLLNEEYAFNKNHIVADIGSGTGLLSELFLENGNTVYGVEPNGPMRAAAENYLKNFSNFRSIDGSAENTGLKNQSVDIVTAGTAFHWFDAKKTKIEFKRILKNSSLVLLVWNVRNVEQSDLLREYENLISNCIPAYSEMQKIKFEKISEFFSPGEMKVRVFKKSQLLDRNGLKGRLLSSSFSLREAEDGYDAMMKDLKIIFDKFQVNGEIEFSYDTTLYLGHL